MMIFSLARDIDKLSVAVLGAYKRDLELEKELQHELCDNNLTPEDTIVLEQSEDLEMP